MSTAPLLNLASVNLNLLVALDALLSEAHVGRAAQRLGVTQSAMSQSLKQLRELYGDPLLTRGQLGLVLTPRAQQIARGIRKGLAELHLTFAPSDFDPETSIRSFALGLSDSTAVAITPPLIKLFAAQAPGVTLRVVPFEADPYRRVEQLENGEAAAMVGADLDAHPQLHRQRLFPGGFVGLARTGHPGIRDRPTLAEYAALTHVICSPGAPDAPSFVDVVLDGAGLRRKVVLRTCYLVLAALVVSESDHVLVVRRDFAASFARRFDLQIFPLPADLEHERDLELELVWHDRFDGDPAHRWLRRCVIQAAELSER